MSFLLSAGGPRLKAPSIVSHSEKYPSIECGGVVSYAVRMSARLRMCTHFCRASALIISTDYFVRHTTDYTQACFGFLSLTGFFGTPQHQYRHPERAPPAVTPVITVEERARALAELAERGNDNLFCCTLHLSFLVP